MLRNFHSKGTILKLITPKNIFLSENNELVIEDKFVNGSVYNENDYIKYIAPENLDNDSEKYTKESDIYCLGCIFYELYTLKKANDDCKKIANRLIKKVEFSRVELPRIIEIEKLISKMLNKLPYNRIKLERIEEILNIIKKKYLPKENNETILPSNEILGSYSIHRLTDGNITEASDIIKSNKSDSIIRSINDSCDSKKSIDERNEYEKDGITDYDVFYYIILYIY